MRHTDGGIAWVAGDPAPMTEVAWPAAAQMLIVGRVIDVSRKENQRIVIVVEPEVSPERVSEVVLRIPESSAPEGAI